MDVMKEPNLGSDGLASASACDVIPQNVTTFPSAESKFLVPKLVCVCIGCVTDCCGERAKVVVEACMTTMHAMQWSVQTRQAHAEAPFTISSATHEYHLDLCWRIVLQGSCPGDYRLHGID